MKKTFWVVSLSVLLVLSLGCKLTTEKKEAGSAVEKIDELVGLFADYQMFNGAILVVDQGEVIYKNGFGWANMEWDIPNQTDTKFKIASLTKQFTAMLIMQLVAENKLELHTPISTYLADFPKDNGNRITIHHLLTHAAGFDHGVDDKKYNKPEDMVNQFASAPLQFAPGSRFGYSNNGYTLLGYIIETITGESYEDVLHKRIFQPLNMKNSGFFRHRPLIKKMASGYNKGFGEYFNTDNSDESSAYAAGAIYATVEDLFLWDQAMITESLLPKKYMELIFKKHMVDNEAHYGYGWELIDKPIGNSSKTIESVGHSGSIDGFRARYTRYPSTNSSIILLSNTSRAFHTAMTTAITGILFDKPYELPLKPLAKFMLQTIENDGIAKGIQFYKDHKDSPDYHASEQELIVAGYSFLHAENAKVAAQIFKLATEVFPDRDNPYDSFAEALMALGKNAEAISNYKKSLALNPKNNNAIERLKKLGVTYSTDLLMTDASWGKELFAIPLHFAPDIELKGFEDARFPKGWNDTTSLYFWTYAFAWKVNLEKELSESEVTDYIKKYYDGLLEGVNTEKDLMLPKTTVEITKSETGNFIGKATIYDTFITKKPLVLHFNIEQIRCENNRNSILVFRISPKNSNHKVWNELMGITIVQTSCD